MGAPKATPKARLFQIYPCGKGLTFVTESVSATPAAEGVVPGSTSFFKPNHAVTYRCTLSLPDGSKLISDLFHRKKDAEHDASQRALDQMRVPVAPTPDVVSVEEKWESLRRRMLETFSDKNVLSYLPLRPHFKAAVKRPGSRYGQVPIAALVALDAKINTLCKAIDRKSDADPVYAVAIVCRAAAKCPSVKLDVANLSISRTEPFTPEVERDLVEGRTEGADRDGREECPNELNFRAIHIPYSLEEDVCSSQILVKQEYYLDVLARKIGLQDGCRLVMSRSLGKSRPALRLYWGTPKMLPVVQSSQSDIAELIGNGHVSNALDHEDLGRYALNRKGDGDIEQKKNVRASLLMGSPVYGDVILAAIGGDWRSLEVYASDVSLNYYYRTILGKFPQGNYKVSRGALLASNLPLSFSGRLQWKGMSPRGLLLDFCQQHRLPEPVFTLSKIGSDEDANAGVDIKISEMTEVTEHDEVPIGKLGDVDNEEEVFDAGRSRHDDNSPQQFGPFSCTVRVEFQKGFVQEFVSSGPHRNRHDAIQGCALQAVQSCRPWFEGCLRGAYKPLLPLAAGSNAVECLSSDVPAADVRTAGTGWCFDPADGDFFELSQSPALDSSQVDQIPPSGAMVTIRYTARWLKSADVLSRASTVLLEKKDDFIFEIGIDAVIPELEQTVAETPVGRTVSFLTALPAPALLLATSDKLDAECASLSSGQGKIMYTVQLLKYSEPPEERMEAALFKPSLSKQRLAFALSVIQKCQAKSLIDLGCGSGSLLENLLEEPTGLEQLVGVDVSAKGLVRAAKVLSTKLMKDLPGKECLDLIKLYEGSIAEFNPVLQGFDVAVCIEVVEHMDSEPLSMFGATILGKLQPRVLIVSTPNHEYNPILQGLEWDPSTNSLLANGSRMVAANRPVEDRVQSGSDSDTGSESVEKRIRLSNGSGKDGAGKLDGKNDGTGPPVQQVKFRNDDHRFEWNRAEFQHWASTTAMDHGYDVAFDGVGGSGEIEGPGYASQIAIFTRRAMQDGCDGDVAVGEDTTHKIAWQWMPVHRDNGN